MTTTPALSLDLPQKRSPEQYRTNDIKPFEGMILMNSRIAFVVGDDWLEWTEGDALLRDALAKHDISCERISWREGTTRLSGFDAVLIRSCWDYHKHPREFAKWLDQLSTVQTPIWNSPKLLRWNMDKRYLNDLDEAGLPILPSEYIAPEQDVDWNHLLEKNDWAEVVVKPLIGASGFRMLRFQGEDLKQYRERLEELVQDRGLIMQPFQKRIQTHGEWSFVFFDENYQYAIHKKPGPDDFRAHNHRGGTYRHADPPGESVRHVENLVDRFPEHSLYLRMDGIVQNNELTIMEVEALEPSFYFTYYPPGAESLAGVINRRLGS